ITKRRTSGPWRELALALKSPDREDLRIHATGHVPVSLNVNQRTRIPEPSLFCKDNSGDKLSQKKQTDERLTPSRGLPRKMTSGKNEMRDGGKCVRPRQRPSPNSQAAGPDVIRLPSRGTRPARHR
ncbi:hypothetical protein BDZ89DRAFT_1067402, partial [Hymenopellis radicata]